MGGKISWQLFSDRKHPVSQVLWKKYLLGGTLRNLQAVNIPKGSLTWNLCQRGLEFFQKHLYRIPGDGRNFFLWEDSIQGNCPLSINSSLIEIKLWLVNKGLLRLANISKWDIKGN